jgi:voltage-gated potassium channel
MSTDHLRIPRAVSQCERQHASRETGDSYGRAARPGGESRIVNEPEPQPQHWPTRLVARRVEKKGLRPRLAAAVIATLWLVAIVVFGITEHLINPQTFDTVWHGMWWATQTVTTVGYGDVVPDNAAGRLIASVLMIGGLSLFAVVTGVITSTFVARAQAETRSEANDPMLARMTAIETQLTGIRTDVARLSAGLDQGSRRDPDVPSPP